LQTFNLCVTRLDGRRIRMLAMIYPHLPGRAARNEMGNVSDGSRGGRERKKERGGGVVHTDYSDHGIVFSDVYIIHKKCCLFVIFNYCFMKNLPGTNTVYIFSNHF